MWELCFYAYRFPKVFFALIHERDPNVRAAEVLSAVARDRARLGKDGKAPADTNGFHVFVSRAAEGDVGRYFAVDVGHELDAVFACAAQQRGRAVNRVRIYVLDGGECAHARPVLEAVVKGDHARKFLSAL